MFGLLLASIDSVVNVLTDVARKKVLDRQFDASLVTVWCKAISCVVFAAALAALQLGWGVRPQLPDIGRSLSVSPSWSFLLYVMLNAVLEGSAILLYLRALQVSPISYCVPFLALTPLFLLPTGIVFLHEAISGGMMIGVFLVVVGALVMNRQMFARGPLEPARAILRERGSRYMLLVALLLTFTNLLDKWFLLAGGGTVSFAVKLSRSVTLSMGKCAMLSVFFVGLAIVRLGDWKAYRKGEGGLWRLAARISWTGLVRGAPVWLTLAGVLDSLVLILQLTAMQFIAAALAISMKRAGIILAVPLGWYVFKERGITDRVIASLVMTAGVLIFFLTTPDAAGRPILETPGAAAVALAALVGMSVALYLTRHRNALGAPEAAAAGAAK
jgi:drug/metabolite transporter (DMT)-like permease